MESFKLWIISFCGAGIISSLFKILVSNSNVKKSVDIFLSMFVFLYTVIPIGNLMYDIKFDIEISEKASYEDLYKNGYEAIIRESIEKICSSNNIEIEDIYIDSYLDENQYLVINKIELELNHNENSEEIKRVIKEELGIEVVII
jgi:hypothetical protein